MALIETLWSTLTGDGEASHKSNILENQFSIYRLTHGRDGFVRSAEEDGHVNTSCPFLACCMAIVDILRENPGSISLLHHDFCNNSLLLLLSPFNIKDTR